MKHKLISTLAGILVVGGFFTSCAPRPGSADRIDNLGGPASMRSKGRDLRAEGLRSGDGSINRNSIDAILNNPRRSERPGLATGWGHRKESSIYDQPFVRESSKPYGVDVIYYNNPEGIKAMASAPQRVSGMQQAAGGLVEWGVKGGLGMLPSYREWGNGRRLVAGSADSTYTIVVKNRSRSTLEIVSSVDGLDVMDGTAASFKKRGYLVEPGATLEIDGFRTSYSSVAAFKFSSVADSYANRRHGDTRNVGVIGMAVFTQQGVNPWTWMPAEVGRRNTAQPFATAPR